MGQIFSDALIESPHRVVVESPHRVKCSNGGTAEAAGAEVLLGIQKIGYSKWRGSSLVGFGIPNGYPGPTSDELLAYQTAPDGDIWQYLRISTDNTSTPDPNTYSGSSVTRQWLEVGIWSGDPVDSGNSTVSGSGTHWSDLYTLASMPDYTRDVSVDVDGEGSATVTTTCTFTLALDPPITCSQTAVQSYSLGEMVTSAILRALAVWGDGTSLADLVSSKYYWRDDDGELQESSTIQSGSTFFGYGCGIAYDRVGCAAAGLKYTVYARNWYILTRLSDIWGDTVGDTKVQMPASLATPPATRYLTPEGVDENGNWPGKYPYLGIVS